MNAFGLPSTDLSILLVDDDRWVRETTAAMLLDAGHAVVEASDGWKALQHLLENGAVDIVISDINMPGLTGLELRREVAERWPLLPVLLVSGRPQPAGLRGFVAKPFAWATLIEAVADVIHKGGANGDAQL